MRKIQWAFTKEIFFVIKLVQLNITKLTMWKVKGNERLKDAIVLRICWLLESQLVLRKMGD